MAYQLSNLDADVSSEIRRKFETWKAFKLPFEGNHFINVAFYYGFQWSVYNTATGELSEVINPAGKIRLTSNQIQPRIRNLHAKMTKNRPIEEVIPTGWSATALHSAEVSRKQLSYFRDIHNEDELDAETVDWLLICGDGFRKVGFDPNGGMQKSTVDKKEFQDFLASQQEDVDQEGAGFQDEGDQVSYPLGEVFDDVVPPFEIYVPEYASSNKLSSCNEVMHVKILPFDEFQAQWGKRANSVMPSSNITTANQFAMRLLGMANPDVAANSAISRVMGRDAADLIYVHELWSKPTRKFPKGRVKITAGDGFTVMFNQPNPYYEALMEVKPLRPYGGIPFVKFSAITTPGRFWALSPVEPMRPLQVEYNKTISDLIQNRATVGRNKIIAPRTANLDEDEIAGIHGQFLQYSGMREPTILPAIPLPQQVERETERNRQDMDTVSGSHEVSRAEVPSGVKSGIAINYLLEQDDSTLAPLIHGFEKGKRHLAMMKLAIARHFYTEARLLEGSEDVDIMAVTHFIGADLSTNIRITPGSGLPQSRAALQATYLDLFERGAIVDEAKQPDPDKLFELLKNTMPVDAFFGEQQLDRARARRENNILSRGDEILPQHYEDHKVHIMEHNKYRKAEAFYQLHPVIRGKFDQHVMIHGQYLAPPVQSFPDMSSMESSKGGPGARGGPGILPSRRTPSFAGSGSMGALNNPPSNKGGTLPGGR